MTKWKVNDGTQVARGEKLHGPGDTFSASEGEVKADGLEAYVTKVDAEKDAEGAEAEQQAQPKADNKAVSAPEPRSAKRD